MACRDCLGARENGQQAIVSASKGDFKSAAGYAKKAATHVKRKAYHVVGGKKYEVGNVNHR